MSKSWQDKVSAAELSAMERRNREESLIGVSETQLMAQAFEQLVCSTPLRQLESEVEAELAAELAAEEDEWK